MRLPRMTTRGWMLAVAIVGLLLGGSLEVVRLRRLGREYAGRAINALRKVSYARRSAGWSHERWLAECRKIQEMDRKWTGFRTIRPLPPDVARARIAYWEPIRSKYERAAVYPWLPIEPDPPPP